MADNSPVGADRPWLSVVTVVKDDPEGLARTLASVADQQHGAGAGRIEVVVLDGSGDRESVEASLGVLAGGGEISLRYEWSPPRGVYPAMNEAAGLATGEYLLFLNAGDEFFDPQAVAAIRRAVDSASSPPAWLYGQVCFVGSSGRGTVPIPFDYAAERSWCFSRGRFPAHQGTVVRRDVLLGLGGFDESYRICADYACFLRLVGIANPIELPETIATFHEGGISTVRWRQSIGEFHRARVQVLAPRGLSRIRELIGTSAQYSRMELAGLLGRRT